MGAAREGVGVNDLEKQRAMNGRIHPLECSTCKLPTRVDGADQCIGWLPGPIMNACCGHDKPRWAYVQFTPWLRIAGRTARACQWVLMRYRDIWQRRRGSKRSGVRSL